MFILANLKKKAYNNVKSVTLRIYVSEFYFHSNFIDRLMEINEIGKEY